MEIYSLLVSNLTQKKITALPFPNNFVVPNKKILKLNY